MEYLDTYDEKGNFLENNQEIMFIKMLYGIIQYIAGYMIKRGMFIFKFVRKNKLFIRLLLVTYQQAKL